MIILIFILLIIIGFAIATLSAKVTANEIHAKYMRSLDKEELDEIGFMSFDEVVTKMRRDRDDEMKALFDKLKRSGLQ